MDSIVVPEIEILEPASSILSPGSLDPIAQRIFPPFLARQRWFQSKSREPERVRVVERILLEPPPSAGKIQALAIVLIEVSFRSGPDETYQLFLALRTGESREESDSPILNLRSRSSGGKSAVLCDALGDPEASLALLESLERRTSLEGLSGRASIERSLQWKTQGLEGSRVRRMGREQSNSSVVFGDALVLKLFRKIEFGTNPELEMGRFLSLRTPFRHVPRLFLSLEYDALEHGAGGLPATLLLVQEFVPSLQDGWKDALDDVRSFYDHSPSGQHQDYLARIEHLGAITGELHELLASEIEDPLFSPEPVVSSDVKMWLDSLRSRLDRVTKLLESHPQGPFKPGASVERIVSRLGSLSDLGHKIRHHGDYHLGQVLRTRDGWMILDFEGEPAKSLKERRLKHSPLRDVAGMIRSFSYAVYAVLFERSSPQSSEWARLEPRALAWEAGAREAFLRGYWSRLRASPLLPATKVREDLLSILELDKAVYELNYELDNRPEWVRIPLRGIERILGRGDP